MFGKDEGNKREEVIKKMLKHLDLWKVKARLPPKLKSPSQETEAPIDYSDSQIRSSDDYLSYDPDYAVEDYAL